MKHECKLRLCMSKPLLTLISTCYYAGPAEKKLVSQKVGARMKVFHQAIVNLQQSNALSRVNGAGHR